MKTALEKECNNFIGYLLFPMVHFEPSKIIVVVPGNRKKPKKSIGFRNPS
jgi:hypothetical protein